MNNSWDKYGKCFQMVPKRSPKLPQLPCSVYLILTRVYVSGLIDSLQYCHCFISKGI